MVPLCEAPAPSRPRVTVVAPCLNEEGFVVVTLKSILEGTYPRDALEVLVVDGGSTDATRRLVGELARHDPRLHLVENPAGSTPAALNIGIRAARGEIIVRVDCHSSYPPDYVAALVDTLESTGADMVGGCLETVAAHQGTIARAIAIALGCPIGTGSPFRYRSDDGPADTVPFGCWRRTLFDEVGLFDERLIRNQDNEHAARILRRGGRIHRTSVVSVRYHPRATLRGLSAQALQNGTWNAFTERLFPYTFRWRHLLPGVLFVGVVAAALLISGGIVAKSAWCVGAGTLLVAPYLLVNAAASLIAAARARRLRLAPLVGVVLWTWHLVYGFGVARGWWLVATGRWCARLPAPVRG
jgi:glycosyltransferase involved in cell wall biosynthesis